MFNHIDTFTLPEVTEQHTAGKHFYKTPTGIIYPSVTTVLGHKEKPYLKDWRNMLGKNKAKKETERCAKRGEAIHKLAEMYLSNAPYPDFLKGQDKQYVAGFNQLKIRLNNINNIRAQEVALYSDKLRLAGRVDCVGEYNGTLSIIDFKTSNNNKDRSMIEDYFIQCTAYAIMWFELTNEPIEDITIIMSVERGMVPLLFKEKIDKYIAPLLQRIDEYYNDNKNL